MKNVLILNITSDVKKENIVDIYCHGQSYNMKVAHETVNNIDEFQNALRGKKLDYLFLAGHANEECFANNNFFHQSWAEIGNIICTAECLNKDSILMLYCCKGGMVNVAYTLFAECPNIRYVLGAKQNMYPIQLTVGFNVFMYHVEHRKTDPVLAARKATDATDIRFECFDRIDAEVNPHWHTNYCKDCHERNQSFETC
jgi:hypothetical protein